MSLEAEAAGSTLQAEMEEGVVARSDALALEQIADDLVSNAIKYGLGRPIDVRLSTGASSVTLSVSDHGIGISPENRARVFDRFERLEWRGQAGGFGVGLWLVGRLVREMGGSIHVDSVPGEGTTFTVRLPTGLKD